MAGTPSKGPGMKSMGASQGKQMPSSSKGKLAPSGPVANPMHIRKGPGPTKLPGTAKGQLGKALTVHPNHKSKVNRSAEIYPEKKGLYPKGMKGTESTTDKSNPVKLPGTNRSFASKVKSANGNNALNKAKNAKTYVGPKGMKGAPEQGEYVKGTGSTLRKSAMSNYSAPKGQTKNPK